MCLPSAGAGDFDQWISTATGPNGVVGYEFIIHFVGVSDGGDVESSGLCWLSLRRALMLMVSVVLL